MEFTYSFQYRPNYTVHVDPYNKVYQIFIEDKSITTLKRFKIEDGWVQYCHINLDPHINCNWNECSNTKFNSLFLQSYKGWDFDTEIENIMAGDV